MQITTIGLDITKIVIYRFTGSTSPRRSSFRSNCGGPSTSFTSRPAALPCSVSKLRDSPLLGAETVVDLVVRCD